MEENKQMDMELVGSNRLVALCGAVESIIIVIAYIMEYVKGARTLGYAMGIAAGFAVFSAALLITFFKKKDSGLIKHIVGIGFPILYIVVLFTTENTLTFTYAIPMIIIVSGYADARYSLMESVGVVIVNILQIVYFLKIGVYNSENTATLEIHIIIVLLITVYLALSVRRIEQNNKNRERRIAEENEKTKQLLLNNLEIGNSTNSTIDALYQAIEELGASIRSTSDAMKEVDQGAGETARNVEAQLEMTTDITGRVEDVSESYKKIVESIANTVNTIKEGKRNIDELVAQSEKMREGGKEVNVKLDDLSGSIKKIESVVTIISGIANQINLLSLNASIEAARAGDAGRGFAVVASEIQNMANSTQAATGDIAATIVEITRAINEVVNVTAGMINGLSEQEEEIKTTANSFAIIENETMVISNNSDELSGSIDKLSEVNESIVNSISNISAVTEQVSAHANSTVESCETDISVVDDIKAKTEELRELAAKLKQND